MSLAITPLQATVLQIVCSGPRPGGYAVDVPTLAELHELGLIVISATLTEAGRKALKGAS